MHSFNTEIAPSSPESFIASQTPPHSPLLPILEIGNAKIFMELATSSAAIQKGLSGRLALAQNQGMLFVFANPDYYRFWMPDMHFPIDIIWIKDHTVVGITPNVSPQFDPRNPRFYLPPEPVQYVLEVHAGFSQKNNIKKGDHVRLHL
ncbi:MAG: hypothetical protein G01um101466_383 [Parcubacteria group bacterium Gr01-1014_66]|nr:MAG: hypothetical protein G01um101466_383 [Parcubacteria group bacterium Gr01-1014_66]